MSATRPDDPERALSLAYAPRAVRPALSALWRLDEQLGAGVARAEDPALAQIRLTWWYDALLSLPGSRPVDPILVALAELPGIDPASLLPLIDGWEALLEPLPLTAEAIERHATDRGGTLFGVAADLLGGQRASAAAAGRLWALTDLAFRVSDRNTAERALQLARDSKARFPDIPRPLGLLAAFAAQDARRGLDRPRRQGSPIRLARAMWRALTRS